MSKQARADTGPELAVRRLLHGSGYRFRVDHPVRPGKGRLVRPDIAFTRAQVAVFVDGCFWHGCPEHCHVPKANNEWWTAKLAMNRARDAAVNDQLAALGWKVLRYWEHEPPDAVADRIVAELGHRQR